MTLCEIIFTFHKVNIAAHCRMRAGAIIKLLTFSVVKTRAGILYLLISDVKALVPDLANMSSHI